MHGIESNLLRLIMALSLVLQAMAGPLAQGEIAADRDNHCVEAISCSDESSVDEHDSIAEQCDDSCPTDDHPCCPDDCRICGRACCGGLGLITVDDGAAFSAAPVARFQPVLASRPLNRRTLGIFHPPRH